MLFPPPRSHASLGYSWPRSLVRHSWSRSFVFALLTVLLILSLCRPDAPSLTAPSTASEAHICGLHNWSPFVPSISSPRKVYDMFMVNDELDWLTIRLHTLLPYVDYFVILESPVTFTGLPKPLFLSQNMSIFQEFSHKIIHRVLKDPPIGSTVTWDYETYQRNALYTQIIPYLEGKEKANEGDVLVISDVDEIPRPSTWELLRACNFPRRLTLLSKFYYYAFQFHHLGPDWAHPQATFYSPQASGGTILPQDLRMSSGSFISRIFEADTLENAAWHCSSCFGTIEELLRKMSSFSHTGLNAEPFRDKKRIVEKVRQGLDLWDRKGELYEKVVGNTDIPDWLVTSEGRERFPWLLERDGMDGGFADYEGVDVRHEGLG